MTHDRLLRVSKIWFRLRALADALWNGLGERLRPASSSGRTGDWGRDVELARRRLMRSRVSAAVTIGTLTVGLGAFALERCCWWRWVSSE